MSLPFLFFILLFLNTDTSFEAPAAELKPEVRVISHHTYEAGSIDGFFKELIKIHTGHFAQYCDSQFIAMCEENNLNIEAQSNITNYYTLQILHMLFTSETASDYSRGPILNIPYMWHWTEPNPRHSIRFTHDETYLKDTKPPVRFSRYNSFADIDRTPGLFLTDLLADTLKYMSTDGGAFSTFGWCSEREMSFVSLLTLMDYEARVIAQGAHSWTECLVRMDSETGPRDFVVRIDNTFDGVNWHEVAREDIEIWRSRRNDNSTGRWYDRVAHSDDELGWLRGFVVGNGAKERIEGAVVGFLSAE